MTVADKKESYILFRVSKQFCGLPLNSVDEIFPFVELSMPPQLPHFLLGFMNVEHVAVPIISLERLFHLATETPDLYDHIICLKNNSQRIGFLVRQAQDIRTFSKNQIRDLYEDMVFNRCAKKEVDDQGQVVHLLDPVQLFLKAEQERIESFQKIEQERLNSLNQA